MPEDARSGIAIKILVALPFALYGLAALTGVICRSWVVGILGVALVAIAL